MEKLIFTGNWEKTLREYDGSPIMIFNDTSKSQDAITQSLKRYLNAYFDFPCRVISRKKILYVNPPLRSAIRVPGVIYFEGDWDVLYDVQLKRCQKVVNLTNDNKRNCDFVRRLNDVLFMYGFDNFEAWSVKGMCVLGTREYFDNPDWKNDWR